MVSQNTRKSCPLVKSMNVFEIQKIDCVPFLSSKPRPKKGRKHFVNRQQTPLRAAKVLFTTTTNVREIKEHERGYE